MDEFQFIESLDALLANEVMDESAAASTDFTNNALENACPPTITNSSTPLFGQGILLGTTGEGTITETSTNTNTNWLIGGTNSSQNPYSIALQPTTSSAPSIASAQLPYHLHLSANTGEKSSASITIATPVASNTINTNNQIGPLNPPAVLASHNSSTATNPVTVAASGGASVSSANSRGSSKTGNNNSSMNTNCSPRNAKAPKSSSRKRSRTTTAVSESEDESSRKRHDRNLREQKRSQKITHQIDQLREVLAAASVRFKPDKYSTLVSVVDYVRQLQNRSSMLDMEHKKLLDTITKTNELVNEPYLNSGVSMVSNSSGSTNSSGVTSGQAVGDANGNNKDGGTLHPNNIYNEDELVFVRNVDYRCIFEKCGLPLAVASIDGRLIDCNEEFVKLTGYKREELLPVDRCQLDHPQKGSGITPNEVQSSFGSSSSSSISGTKGSVEEQNKIQRTNPDNSGRSSNNTSTMRNFSLFNLLNRSHMEEVFISLSEMLKHPPEDESGSNHIPSADYWSGVVRFSRNSHFEIRINISLVRSPQGRAKFFDCSLTLLN